MTLCAKCQQEIRQVQTYWPGEPEHPTQWWLDAPGLWSFSSNPHAYTVCYFDKAGLPVGHKPVG